MSNRTRTSVCEGLNCGAKFLEVGHNNTNLRGHILRDHPDALWRCRQCYGPPQPGSRDTTGYMSLTGLKRHIAHYHPKSPYKELVISPRNTRGTPGGVVERRGEKASAPPVRIPRSSRNYEPCVTYDTSAEYSSCDTRRIEADLIDVMCRFAAEELEAEEMLSYTSYPSPESSYACPSPASSTLSTPAPSESGYTSPYIVGMDESAAHGLWLQSPGPFSYLPSYDNGK